MGKLEPTTRISDAKNENEIIHSPLLGRSTRGRDGEKPIPCRMRQRLHELLLQCEELGASPGVSQAAGPPVLWMFQTFPVPRMLPDPRDAPDPPVLGCFSTPGSPRVPRSPGCFRTPHLPDISALPDTLRVPGPSLTFPASA